MNGFFKDKTRPLVLGHRGVPLAHQENTMAGFRKAVELGIDGVELDVFATRDGKVVVFHDENIERLTGEKGSLSDMTWDELSKLKVQKRIAQSDTSSDFQQYPTEQRIPLLEEVLDEFADKLLINIEMKAYKPMWSRRHTGALVADIIRKTDSCDRVISTSFDFFMLRELENTYCSVHSGFTYDDSIGAGLQKWIRLLPEIGSEFSMAEGNQNHMTFLNMLLELNSAGHMVGSSVVGAEHNLIDSDTVTKFHQRNMIIGAYTLFPVDTRTVSDLALNHEQEARRLASMGIDWIETDDPARLQQLLTR